MTLTQYSYIVAVSKYGSFNEAAKKCFVTQPTLSMQINKLEQYLGVKIFDRSSKPVKPTPIGTKIIDQAKITLSEASKVEEIVNEESAELKGDFTIAMIPTVAPYLVSYFVKDIVSRYKELRLIVKEHKTEDIIRLLKTGEIDAAILATPLLDEQLIEYPLFNDEMKIYASREDKNFSQQLPPMGDLPIESLLLLNEGNCLRIQTLNICKQMDHNETERLSFESGNLQTLISMVDDGLGYTILPELAITSMEHLKGKIISYDINPPSRQISFVSHENFFKNKKKEVIIQTILKNIPEKFKQDKSTKTISIY